MNIKVNGKTRVTRISVTRIKRKGHRAVVGHSLFIHPKHIEAFNKLAGRA